MPTRGGARKGAGRKRQSQRARVAHAPRADFRPEHPLHITLRMRDDMPSLRAYEPWVAIVRALRAARARESLRVIHYSVMSNHFHLLVEADGREALTLGMRSLMTRLATALNRAFRRRGPVFADRFHVRAVTTPRATRYALQYVLLNARKHAAEAGRVPTPGWIDRFSSAARFDGWRGAPDLPHANADFGTSPPRTWLLQWGWRRHGSLPPGDLPGGHRGTPPMRQAA
jgi:REP element-mobilizing transposase RayT